MSTKPTSLATGVVCHPDTEQSRPYKIPWSCRGLNRGPTADISFCYFRPKILVVVLQNSLRPT